MKKLAKETAIYGVSSIAGKFINWLLVPMYSFVLAGTAEYGVVINLYAWTALVVVILTYGMETGFFRFAHDEKYNINKVYSTTLTSLGVTSLLFIVLCTAFPSNIAQILNYPDHPEYIIMLGISVAIDAFATIPFAYLRFERRPIKFAAVKLLNIFLNIFFNVFFLVICPWLADKAPSLIDWFYAPDYGVGYVFVSNILSTTLYAIVLFIITPLPKCEFDKDLLKKMLRYSFPLLILGIAGIMNQTLDKIIFPFLLEDKNFAESELGIYGACFKISMVMMMFTQAFRYAYEPFVFSKHKDKNSKAAYADAMKYFVIFSLLIFLGMVFYLDILKLLLKPIYWGGLQVVPIVLWSYIFQGIFFNLSMWYKLLDKTQFGIWFSLVGVVITLALNVVLVPKISYMGSAWASFVCYLVMLLLSYFFGQKYMPIQYNLKTIGLYIAVTLVLYAASFLVNSQYEIVNLLYRTVLLGLFILLMVKRDFPLSEIPFVKKFVK